MLDKVHGMHSVSFLFLSNTCQSPKWNDLGWQEGVQGYQQKAQIHESGWLSLNPHLYPSSAVWPWAPCPTLRPQFCHVPNAYNSSFVQVELLQGLNERMLAQCLVYSKDSTIGSYYTLNMMLVWLLFVMYLMWSQSTLLALPQAAARSLLAGAWSRCDPLLPICQGESSAASGQREQPTY